MSWKRLVVLAAAIACTTCSTVPVQHNDAGSVAVRSSIDDLGVCGPVHEAMLRFMPVADDGSFDHDVTQYEPYPPDSSQVLMPFPESLEAAFADSRPAVLELREFRGTTQAIGLHWPTDEPEELEHISRAIGKRLTRVFGKPVDAWDEGSEWTDGRLRVATFADAANSITSLWVACVAREDAYAAALESLDALEEAPPDEAPTESAASASHDPDGLPPNPWLDRSIVDLLLGWGPPLEEPIVTEDDTVGLHYRDFMPGFDVPVEGWWWFVDGKAVYAASEFMPPKGSDRPLTSYRAFKNMLREAFGAPNEEIFDEETGQRHVIYHTGPQRLVMTLFDPEGDPWFRVEIFDTTKLEALPSELRPNRSLPERYEPPPTDSGFTREDMGFAVGAG